MVGMACCGCCKGACCYDVEGTPTCSKETLEDCIALSGQWQGPGTSCVGEDECPCDPPAEHGECQRCIDGGVVTNDPDYCCEEDCDCCEDDSFSFYEEAPGGGGDCITYPRGQSMTLDAGPGAYTSFDAWLSSYGVTKKAGSPERACVDSARVYRRSTFLLGFGDIACEGTVEVRIYVPDCSTGELIDITSDYDAPEGFFDYEIADLPDVPECYCPAGELLPMPPLPVCNPIP